eukprot:1131281-Amorphochlora_amoeboformis.AAC.1
MDRRVDSGSRFGTEVAGCRCPYMFGKNPSPYQKRAVFKLNKSKDYKFVEIHQTAMRTKEMNWVQTNKSSIYHAQQIINLPR